MKIFTFLFSLGLAFSLGGLWNQAWASAYPREVAFSAVLESARELCDAFQGEVSQPVADPTCQSLLDHCRDRVVVNFKNAAVAGGNACIITEGEIRCASLDTFEAMIKSLAYDYRDRILEVCPMVPSSTPPYPDPELDEEVAEGSNTPTQPPGPPSYPYPEPRPEESGEMDPRPVVESTPSPSPSREEVETQAEDKGFTPVPEGANEFSKLSGTSSATEGGCTLTGPSPGGRIPWAWLAIPFAVGVFRRNRVKVLAKG